MSNKSKNFFFFDIEGKCYIFRLTLTNKKENYDPKTSQITWQVYNINDGMKSCLSSDNCTNDCTYFDWQGFLDKYPKVILDPFNKYEIYAAGFIDTCLDNLDIGLMQYRNSR